MASMQPIRELKDANSGGRFIDKSMKRTAFLRRSLKRKLSYVGARPKYILMLQSWLFLFLCIIVAIGILTYHPQVPAEFTASLLTLGAFMFAVQQWIATRRENSMDKYFERRELVNKRLDMWPHAQSLVSHFWGGEMDERSYQKYMYVYIELDNLEYVIEKYRIGFIDVYHAWRGLETFMSRCESSEFRTIAATVVNIAGYTQATRKAVQRIVDLWM
jgi:hypothetical protein